MSGRLKKLYSLFCQNDYWHGVQCAGKHYNFRELSGYYNDLTKKVLPISSVKVSEFVPSVCVGSESFIHPVTVCQVGLGAFDKYIETEDSLYLKKAIACCDWLNENASICSQGVVWFVPYPFPLFGLKKNFISGLIQGQAISLLVRVAGKIEGQGYATLAEKAYGVLVTDVAQGGCKATNSYLLEEYPDSSGHLVLNGCISAIWGVYDYWLFSKKTSVYSFFERSCAELSERICEFDTGFWSKYCLKRNSFWYSNLASPYYHREHIEQLKVMFEMYPLGCFKLYVDKWSAYSNNLFSKGLVYTLKVGAVCVQKVLGYR